MGQAWGVTGTSREKTNPSYQLPQNCSLPWDDDMAVPVVVGILRSAGLYSAIVGLSTIRKLTRVEMKSSITTRTLKPNSLLFSN